MLEIFQFTDIHKGQTMHMAKTHFLFEHLYQSHP